MCVGRWDRQPHLSPTSLSTNADILHTYCWPLTKMDDEAVTNGISGWRALWTCDLFSSPLLPVRSSCFVTPFILYAFRVYISPGVVFSFSLDSIFFSFGVFIFRFHFFFFSFFSVLGVCFYRVDFFTFCWVGLGGGGGYWGSRGNLRQKRSAAGAMGLLHTSSSSFGLESGYQLYLRFVFLRFVSAFFSFFSFWFHVHLPFNRIVLFHGVTVLLGGGGGGVPRVGHTRFS